MYEINEQKLEMSSIVLHEMSDRLWEYENRIETVRRSLKPGTTSAKSIDGYLRQEEQQLHDMAHKMKNYSDGLKGCVRIYRECDDCITEWDFRREIFPVIIRKFNLTDVTRQLHGLGEIKF